MIYRHLGAFTGAILATSVVAGLVLSAPVSGGQDEGARYEGYVGNYEITPTFILSITLEGETLYAEATGQRKFELIPVSEHDFSYKDSQYYQSLVFAVDANGQASSVTQRAGDFSRVAQRTDQPILVDPSVLADAVLAGDVDRVRALIRAGADIHALDTRPRIAGSNGRRPLNHAALQNDVQMINTLLELGVDIDRQNLSGFTPLHHAVEAQSEEAIELLVSRGADTTIENRRNLTPEEFAVAAGRSQAAAALAKAMEARQ